MYFLYIYTPIYFLYFYTSDSHQLLKSASGLSECFPEDRVGGVVENAVLHVQHLKVFAGGEH